MASKPSSASDERGSTPIPSDVDPASRAKEPARAFLDPARRALSEAELSVPAVRRFLIDEAERLDQECSELRPYVGKYHDQRVEIAVLTAENRSSKWIEVLSSICLAIGSALFGAAPSYFSIKEGFAVGVALLIASAVLIVGGIAPKVFK